MTRVASRYNLSAPTRESVLASLESALGLAEAQRVWERAFRTVGLNPEQSSFSPDQLLAVANYLSSFSGQLGVLGASLSIRLSTFRALNRLHCIPSRQAADAAARKGMPDRVAKIAEPERSQEITDLGLLSGDPDPELQKIVEEVAAEMNLPTALVSLVMDDAQRFVAAHGLPDWMAEAGGTPIEWSFCAKAVESGKPFVVEDAERHQDVQNNPLVTEDGIRSYLGVPLVTSHGHTLGTLCVLGDEPRSFSPDDLALLRERAGEVTRRIEQRRRVNMGRSNPGLS